MYGTINSSGWFCRGHEGDKKHEIEMSISPDTLQVLLIGFVSLAWSTALESVVLGLPDLV